MLRVHPAALALLRGPLESIMHVLWTPEEHDTIYHPETWEMGIVSGFPHSFQGPLEAWVWVPTIDDFIGYEARIAGKLGAQFCLKGDDHKKIWKAGYYDALGLYSVCPISVELVDPLVALLIALAHMHKINPSLLERSILTAEALGGTTA